MAAFDGERIDAPGDVRRPAPGHGIVVSLTPWLGREVEQAQLAARLRDAGTRLVSLIGVGGVGKTRLALEVARALTLLEPPPFPQGVYFVSMAALAPEPPFDLPIITQIAGAVGLSLAGPDSALDQLCNFLQARRVLLVIDNFEHLVAGAACLSEILQRTSATMLVTSRERLHLRGEQVFPLEGLPLGDARSGAAALFAHVAQASMGAFAISGANAESVERICRLVEGLPLGIELAAGLARVLPIDELAQELERSLDALETAGADVPERQHSLRAVFEHSWGLLPEYERTALRRLAVFRGSFTRDAAAAIAGAPLPLLAALLDKSLVRRLAGLPARYELPMVLQQYAGERLAEAGEADAYAARHAAYYAALLAGHIAALRGPGQRAALDAISAESAPVRAAWHYALLKRDAATLERATDGLFHFYDMQSWFQEGAQQFGAARRALESQRDEPEVAPVWARLLAREAWFTFHLGQQQEAWSLMARSLEALRALGRREDLIFPLNYGGAVRSYMGDFAATRALCGESLDLCAELGERYGEAIACNILGQAAYDERRYDEARAWSERSLAIERELGNRWSMAYSLTNLGKVRAAQGDHAAARGLFEESLAIREELGDQRGVAMCLGRLGDVAAALGEPAVARDHYERSLALFREIGTPWGVASALINLGRFALDQGDTPAALPALQEALRLARKTGVAPQVAAIEALLARAAAPTPSLAPTAPTARPAAFPGGLTSREVDVLRLVAQGLTDKEVADRLVVSPRTVSTHLTAIYGKLQINTRSAATRYAIEHGLI